MQTIDQETAAQPMAQWRATGGAIDAAAETAPAADDGLMVGGYSTSFCPVMAPERAPARWRPARPPPALPHVGGGKKDVDPRNKSGDDA